MYHGCAAEKKQPRMRVAERRFVLRGFFILTMEREGGEQMEQLEADVVRSQSSGAVQKRRNLFGRRMIKLPYREINSGNVLEAVGKAMSLHSQNASEIRYLWDYYCGKQPILGRNKEIRPEINNKIVVNVANEIVSFIVGYRVGEPVQYIGRNSNGDVPDSIIALNDYMFAEDKASKDQELVEWQAICGTSYRMMLPDSEERDDSPFELYTLDPRETFVAYSTALGNKPLFGGTFFRIKDGYEVDVYTANEMYIIQGPKNDILGGHGMVVKVIPHALGMVPIFEYPANRARTGAFEIVIDLLDALNSVTSNRLDGVEQTIQSFLKFINCQIDKETMNKVKELGAIMIKSIQGQTADVDTVKNDLDQEQTQTLKNDLYQTVLTICGIPNRNGGTSTSDTGSAVIFRDGWETAESRAKDFEHMFKRSERHMLRLALRICESTGEVNLRLCDVDMKFTRRNYENIQSKSQVLTTMLGNGRIHPRLAFEHCGLFSDPESAYQMSEKYYQEQMKAWTPEEVNESETNSGGAVQTA